MPGCLVLLLALGLPVFDAWLLFGLGDRIGGGQTLALVLLSMFLGLTLARRQRAAALDTLRTQLAGGQLPTAAMADGPMLMLASVLFALPGLLTDALGLLLLVPPLRRALFALAARSMLRAAREGRVNVRLFGGTFGTGGGFGAGGGFGTGGGFGAGHAEAGSFDAGTSGAGRLGSQDAATAAGADGGGGAGPIVQGPRNVKELPPGSYRVHEPDGSP